MNPPNSSDHVDPDEMDLTNDTFQVITSETRTTTYSDFWDNAYNNSDHIPKDLYTSIMTTMCKQSTRHSTCTPTPPINNDEPKTKQDLFEPMFPNIKACNGLLLNPPLNVLIIHIVAIHHLGKDLKTLNELIDARDSLDPYWDESIYYEEAKFFDVERFSKDILNGDGCLGNWTKKMAEKYAAKVDFESDLKGMTDGMDGELEKEILDAVACQEEVKINAKALILEDKLVNRWRDAAMKLLLLNDKIKTGCSPEPIDADNQDGKRVNGNHKRPASFSSSTSTSTSLPLPTTNGLPLPQSMTHLTNLHTLHGSLYTSSNPSSSDKTVNLVFSRPLDLTLALKYPEDIKAPRQGCRYDKEFLLQFKDVVEFDPSMDWGVRAVRVGIGEFDRLVRMAREVLS